MALYVVPGHTNNAAARPSELTLQRLHPHNRRVEMLLEKFLQNVHKQKSQRQHSQRYHRKRATLTFAMRARWVNSKPV